MTHRFADVTFTECAKAVQEYYGSRVHNECLQRNFGPNEQLSPRETEFISLCDTFYLASVSETGWAYVQHRGGPEGFLKVLSSNQLAYADFCGNTQLITVGNATKNDRCSLILMDYPNRRRLKILGHMRVEDSHSIDVADLAKVELPEYKARVERVVFIDVAAFDWNCAQHITRRYTDIQIAERHGLRGDHE